MTMATATIGMLALAIGGAEAWSNGPPYLPKARAIAGGLAFSTSVPLLALPYIYSLLDDARLWMRQVIADARAGHVRRVTHRRPEKILDTHRRGSVQFCQSCP